MRQQHKSLEMDQSLHCQKINAMMVSLVPSPHCQKIHAMAASLVQSLHCQKKKIHAMMASLVIRKLTLQHKVDSSLPLGS